MQIQDESFAATILMFPKVKMLAIRNNPFWIYENLIAYLPSHWCLEFNNSQDGRLERKLIFYCTSWSERNWTLNLCSAKMKSLCLSNQLKLYLSWNLHSWINTLPKSQIFKLRPPDLIFLNNSLLRQKLLIISSRYGISNRTHHDWLVGSIATEVHFSQCKP